MQTKPLAHDEVDREVGKHLVNVGSVRAVSRFPRLNAEDWVNTVLSYFSNTND